MMKTLGITILILASSAAYAQESHPSTTLQTPAGPTLQIPGDDSSTRLDVEIGAVRLTTHSGRYTFAYLPFLAPLPGTAFRSSMEMPNALALTGTTIPQRPRNRSFAIIAKR
jgi:hypothetical protein